jgi:hypothetical protein
MTQEADRLIIRLVLVHHLPAANSNNAGVANPNLAQQQHP